MEIFFFAFRETINTYVQIQFVGRSLHSVYKMYIMENLLKKIIAGFESKQF